MDEDQGGEPVVSRVFGKHEVEEAGFARVRSVGDVGEVADAFDTVVVSLDGDFLEESNNKIKLKFKKYEKNAMIEVNKIKNNIPNQL